MLIIELTLAPCQLVDRAISYTSVLPGEGVRHGRLGFVLQTLVFETESDPNSHELAVWANL